jgi:hypothetical protein
LLPVVIALGLAISVVSITALNAVSQNSQTLNAQYYSEIANEAAQARKRDFINATRSLVTKAQPSLPHRAGKALARCRANVLEFNGRPPVPYVHRPGRKVEHRIVVHGVAHPEFDARRLAKLAIRLKRDGYRRDC